MIANADHDNPAFQFEDELLLEGGGDVMWGRKYQRRGRANADGQPSRG
jgi:hypothetical protein